MSLRDSSIDYIKGMLMLGVVYGHVVSEFLAHFHNDSIHGQLVTLFRTYDLPLFMVISGYFLKKSLEKYSPFSVILNRISTIVIPISVWSFLRGQVNIFGMYYFLWAVVVSAAICVLGRLLASQTCITPNIIIELIIDIFFVVVLHVVYLPWNLFFLYPFFVFGYYMRNIKFQLSGWLFLCSVISWAIGLCFWNVNYNPWNLGPIDWMGNPKCLLLYVYRFVLAVVGFYVVVPALGCFRLLIKDTRFDRIVIGAGRESMFIYIFHTIMVSILLKRGFVLFLGNERVEIPRYALNLGSFVVAPMITWFFVEWSLLLAEILKGNKYLKYTTGFRIKK